jgi:hypothetical protein
MAKLRPRAEGARRRGKQRLESAPLIDRVDVRRAPFASVCVCGSIVAALVTAAICRCRSAPVRAPASWRRVRDGERSDAEVEIEVALLSDTHLHEL